MSAGHDREPGKTAKPIEMPFGVKTGVCPRIHVSHGVDNGATWRIRWNAVCGGGDASCRTITAATFYRCTLVYSNDYGQTFDGIGREKCNVSRLERVVAGKFMTSTLWL